MRAGRLIAVAGLFWACALGWAVLIPACLPHRRFCTPQPVMAIATIERAR